MRLYSEVLLLDSLLNFYATHFLKTVTAPALRPSRLIITSALLAVLAGCSQAPTTTTAPAEKPVASAPSADQSSNGKPLAKVGGNCFVDTQKRTSETLELVGWAYGSLSESPKSIAIKVVTGDKSPVFPANFYNRPDIAKAFKSSALVKTGFNIQIPAAEVPAGSAFSILIEDSTGAYTCKNVFKAQ